MNMLNLNLTQITFNNTLITYLIKKQKQMKSKI